uniref:Peptide transporter PTR2 n=1 Tax=Aegilops tauschii TaxID=37682 RepID=R7VZG5_AEGTA
MAAANGTAEFAGLRHNGIKFLLDPVDRLPLREVTAGDGHPDPLVLMAVGPTAPARADSSCAVTVGELGGTAGQSNSAQKRKQSPTQSVESTGMVNLDAPDWTRRWHTRQEEGVSDTARGIHREMNPEAPSWTRRLRVGCAPADRKPCPGGVTPLEETIRNADKSSDSVVTPEIGMSFDSQESSTSTVSYSTTRACVLSTTGSLVCTKCIRNGKLLASKPVRLRQGGRSSQDGSVLLDRLHLGTTVFLHAGTEFCYCLAFYGISYNLVTYLTGVLGQSNVAAARNVSTWQATCFLMPLGGAVVADSYCGRYRTMVVSCFIGVAGMLTTAFSAYLPLLVENGVSFRGLTSSNMVSVQEFVLFLGLYMIAVGLGGLRPCLMSFGADQFDDGDPSERVTKGSFFNWYVFNMSCASLISSTAIVWVQDHYGWALGLTVPAVVLAVGLSCLVAASRTYRFQRTRGSPLTRVCQVVVAAVRKCGVELPADSSLLYDMPEDDLAMKGVERIAHTTDLRFFDKAAIVVASDKDVEAAAVPVPRSPWRLRAVPRVEELKILVRMLPLWATVVFFYAVSVQISSTFVEQGRAMNATVGSVHVPPASMSTFDILTIILLVPLYDRVFVPAARRLTGREKGISELQRIGAGLTMPVLAMAAAARLAPPTVYDALKTMHTIHQQ